MGINLNRTLGLPNYKPASVTVMTKWLSILSLFILFFSCKKAFTPQGALSDTNKYLVIEGTINTGNDSTIIKLSRTKLFNPDSAINIAIEPNAQVSIESDANNSYPLVESKPGTYSAPPLNLGNTHNYRLNIKTKDGKQYLSDYVPAENSPAIDSVGYLTQSDGVHIYVNTHDATNVTHYYRWEFTEAWQFHAYFESLVRGDEPRYQCFAQDTSSSILINSTIKLSQDVVYQAPLAILPANSEKIETKYTILVKQYALTSDAFNFWQNLDKNSDQLGSIFDAQPTANQTNYHCVGNPNEIVIGYLSAGVTATKRIYVTAAQLLSSYSPGNPLGCELETAYYYQAPFYFDPAILGPNSGNSVINEIFISPLGPFGAPNSETYSRTICNDCTLRGSLNPPSFWQ